MGALIVRVVTLLEANEIIGSVKAIDNKETNKIADTAFLSNIPILLSN